DTTFAVARLGTSSGEADDGQPSLGSPWVLRVHATAMYFSYAITALWYDRQRYLPGVLAVAFSATLMALQWGLLLGVFLFASLTVDRSQADVWVAGPNVQAADLGGRIPERYLERLASQPEVEYAEVLLEERTFWVRSDGRVELCLIIGTRLEEGALGAVPE